MASTLFMRQCVTRRLIGRKDYNLKIQQGEKIYNDTMLHLHIHTTDGGTNMDWNLGYGTADCGESVYAL